jgi:predicted RNA-binding protein with PUA-like domain
MTQPEHQQGQTNHEHDQQIEQSLNVPSFGLFFSTNVHFGAAHQTRCCMTTQYWLVKSEPEAYSWDDLVREHRTDWTGVRNNAARLHLRAMRRGDQVLFYESVSTKAVLGLAEVSRAAFPDPTAAEPGWVAVGLKAVRPLARPVTLAAIKGEPKLARMVLLRISRLSVQPVAREDFAHVIRLGGV